MTRLVVGHPWRDRFTERLPQAILVNGPVSTGRARALAWVLDHHRVTERLEIAAPLRVEGARDAARWANVTAGSGQARAVVADLDRASPAALNALLRPIEEAVGVVWALYASGPVLATVASRCEVVATGYLSDAQVVDVLVDVLGMDEAVAQRRAAIGRGQIAKAIDTDADAGKGRALSMLKAAVDGDLELGRNATKKVEAADRTALRTALREAATNRFAVFESHEVFGMDAAHNRPKVAAFAAALRTGARDRIAVRAGCYQAAVTRRTGV